MTLSPPSPKTSMRSYLPSSSPKSSPSMVTRGLTQKKINSNSPPPSLGGVVIPVSTTATKQSQYATPKTPYHTDDNSHKYVKMFVSKSHQQISKAELREQARKKWEMALATKKIASFIKRKQQNRIKLPPVKRSFATLVYPKELMPYPSGAGVTYLCEICNLPCPSAAVHCKFCPIVVHSDCLPLPERWELMKISQEFNPRIKNNNRVTSSNSYDSSYVCKLCTSDAEDDLQWYNKSRKVLFDTENENALASLIGLWIRGFIARVRYRKCRLGVIRTQALVRRSAARRRFWAWRRNMKRPMRISVVGLEGVPGLGTAVTEVAQGSKKKGKDKTKRRTSENLNARKSRSLHKDDQKSEDHRQHHPNLPKQAYVVVTLYNSLREQVVRFDTAHKNVPAAAAGKGNNLGGDFAWQPQNFLIQGIHGLSEVTLTVVSHDPNHHSTGGVAKDIVHGQCHVSLAQNDLWLKGGRVSVDLNKTIKYNIWENRAQEAQFDYEKAESGGKVTLDVTELWSKHSVCGPLHGPHLDVLLTLTKKNGGGGQQNISKISQKIPYWGVVTDGIFHVFRHFGEKEPKVSVDVNGMVVRRGMLTGRSGKEVVIGGEEGARKGSLTSPLKGGAPTKGAAKKGFTREHRRTTIADTTHLREFILKFDDKTSLNRQKYVFECHTVKECNLFIEMLEYWIGVDE